MGGLALLLIISIVTILCVVAVPAVYAGDWCIYFIAHGLSWPVWSK